MNNTIMFYIIHFPTLKRASDNFTILRYLRAMSSENMSTMCNIYNEDFKKAKLLTLTFKIKSSLNGQWRILWKTAGDKIRGKASNACKILFYSPTGSFRIGFLQLRPVTLS